MFRCESLRERLLDASGDLVGVLPTCLARDNVTVPLTFELGWRGGERGERRLPLRRLAVGAESGRGDERRGRRGLAQ